MKSVHAFAVAIMMLGACNPERGDQKSSAGKSTVDNAQAEPVVFPSTFPAYIPAYPGARKLKGPTSGMTDFIVNKVSGGNGVSFLTPDAPEAVIAFYRSEFTKSGLVEDTSDAKPPQKEITFMKLDGESGVVVVMADKILSPLTKVDIAFVSAETETQAPRK